MTRAEHGLELPKGAVKPRAEQQPMSDVLQQGMGRRTFLKLLGTTAVTLALGGLIKGEQDKQASSGQVPASGAEPHNGGAPVESGVDDKDKIVRSATPQSGPSVTPNNRMISGNDGTPTPFQPTKNEASTPSASPTLGPSETSTRNPEDLRDEVNKSVNNFLGGDFRKGLDPRAPGVFVQNFSNNHYLINHSETSKLDNPGETQTEAYGVLLGTLEDKKRDYVVMGSVSKTGKPFVWVSAIGLKDTKTYPHLDLFYLVEQTSESPQSWSNMNRSNFVKMEDVYGGLSKYVGSEAHVTFNVFHSNCDPSTNPLVQAGVTSCDEIGYKYDTQNTDTAKEVVNAYDGVRDKNGQVSWSSDDFQSKDFEGMDKVLMLTILNVNQLPNS